MLQEAARRVEERRARSESPSRVAAGFLPTAASVAGATPGAAGGPARSEDEATSQLEAMMRAWGDSSFYEPIMQAVLDNSPVITPLSAKQVVKEAIKRLPVLDEADARPTGYEGRSGARTWPTLQTFWAEGDHETVISALQMMIQIEVVYQKYLVNGYIRRRYG